MMMHVRKLASWQLQHRVLRMRIGQMQLSCGLLQSGLLPRFQHLQACCRTSWWTTTWLHSYSGKGR